MDPTLLHREKPEHPHEQQASGTRLVHGTDRPEESVQLVAVPRFSRSADGRYSIDEIPVIMDSRLDVADKYAISYGGGKFWDC